jgi:2-amino-4-hydroxy-6-hydroxymethyldihydropteridine diphosphokinase
MATTATTAAFVAVGSNINPEENIPEALARLHAQAPLVALSAFYITPPIARPGQADYYNGMAVVTSACSARVFKYEVLRPIEDALGRVRTGDKFAARTIDLDIALYGSAVIDEPGLRVPDADLRRRPFLLACLVELAPAMVLPDTGERASALISPETVARLRPAATFTQRLRERFGL